MRKVGAGLGYVAAVIDNNLCADTQDPPLLREVGDLTGNRYNTKQPLIL